jgi:hypothetical protein
MNGITFPAYFYSFSGTSLYTGIIPHTFWLTVSNLRKFFYGFWILAPTASKETAFEKYCGTDPWTIMD